MARAYTVYCNSETTRWQDALNQALPAGRLNFILGEALTLTLIVRDDDGTAVDLTGNTTGWNLALKDPADLDGTTLLASKAGVVTDATAGTLTFTFTASDLNSTALATYLADPLGAPGYGKPVAVEAYTLPASDKTVYASGTGTAQRSAYRTGDPSALNQTTLALAFGTGADGALSYTAAAGWTLAGVAMTTSANNWTVSGASLIYLRTLNCTSIDIEAGGTAQAGADNTANWPKLCATGLITNNGTIQAHLVGVDSVGSCMSSGGASRTTTGTGTAPSVFSASVMSQAPAGGSGAGGGTASNLGGSRHAPTLSYYVHAIRIAGGSLAAGTTGAGANGQAVGSMVYSNDPDALLLVPGMPGAGGGSGGVTLGTGTATSGAGGTPGRGGGVLVIRCRGLVNSGTISADGEAGGNGGAADTTGNAQAGGGGGGSGGGGGLVLGYYGDLGWTNTGTIQATRGAAGTGGAGSDSGSASASYNGGNGGTTALGIVATKKVTP